MTLDEYLKRIKETLAKDYNEEEKDIDEIIEEEKESLADSYEWNKKQGSLEPSIDDIAFGLFMMM